jgi:hypothetical protein
MHIKSPNLIVKTANTLSGWAVESAKNSSTTFENISKRNRLPEKHKASKPYKTLELALYHNVGALPQPVEAHKFF